MVMVEEPGEISERLSLTFSTAPHVPHAGARTRPLSNTTPGHLSTMVQTNGPMTRNYQNSHRET